MSSLITKTLFAEKNDILANQDLRRQSDSGAAELASAQTFRFLERKNRDNGCVQG